MKNISTSLGNDYVFTVVLKFDDTEEARYPTSKSVSLLDQKLHNNALLKAAGIETQKTTKVVEPTSVVKGVYTASYIKAVEVELYTTLMENGLVKITNKAQKVILKLAAETLEAQDAR